MIFLRQSQNSFNLPKIPAQLKSLIEFSLTLLFFTLATLVFTWPLANRLSDSLPDWGDPPDVAWKMQAIAEQLLKNPLQLYANPNFYPLPYSIALGELLTGLGFLAAPVIWLTDNPVLAYNLLNFLSFVLSGLAMWLLVRYLTGSSSAGLVSGIIYAFSPWHFGQYGHLPLSNQQWMVFALYFLVRALTTRPNKSQASSGRGRKLFKWLSAGRNWGGFVVFFVLQALVAGYFAYFEAILVGLFLLYFLGWRRGSGLLYLLQQHQSISKSWRVQTLSAGTALLVAGSLIVPFVLPYTNYQKAFNFRRELTEVSYWSAAPVSLLQTAPESWWYKPLQNNIFKLETSAERMLYPGVIAVILALLGLLGWLKTRRQTTSNQTLWGWWAFGGWIALTGLLLSFGPVLNLAAYGENSTGLSLPYKWLYGWIPGFDALRVPLRFGQLMMLGLAVSAGCTVAWLLPLLQKHLPTLLTKGLLITLLLADFFVTGLPAVYTGVGVQAPEVYKWLYSEASYQQIPADAVMLELPITQQSSPVTTSPIYLLYNFPHGRPMLNGSANIIPAGYNRLVYEMYSFPAAETLDIIEGLEVDFLLVHTGSLISEANRLELEKQTAAGRLEVVKSFESLVPVAGASNLAAGRDIIYRVNSTRAREQWAKLAALLPANSDILLLDDSKSLRLYNTALPYFLGQQQRYYANYSTIYHRSLLIQPATPGKSYPYAIFYRNSAVTPASLGYSSQHRLWPPPEQPATEKLVPIELYYKP